MSVKQIRKGVYGVYVRVKLPSGKTIRKRRNFTGTRKHAERHERELREWMLNGCPAEQKIKVIPTLKVFAQDFLESYAKPTNSASEYRAKECHFRVHLVPALGHLRLDAIGRREVDVFIAKKLEGGSSKARMNKVLGTLARCLNIAVEWEVIETAPKIKQLKTKSHELEFWSFAEFDALLAAAEPGWRAIILLAGRTGLRQGELLGLRWCDIDMEQKMLHVRQAYVEGIIKGTKSGKARAVPMESVTLQALLDQRIEGSEFVFSRPDGQGLTEHRARPHLEKACAAAGLKKCGWHKLRHTFASHLAIKGASMLVLQQLLGHSDVRVTMRYAHLSPEVHREAIELLGKVSASSSVTVCASLAESEGEDAVENGVRVKGDFKPDVQDYAALTADTNWLQDFALGAEMEAAIRERREAEQNKVFSSDAIAVSGLQRRREKSKAPIGPLRAEVIH